MVVALVGMTPVLCLWRCSNAKCPGIPFALRDATATFGRLPAFFEKLAYTSMRTCFDAFVIHAPGCEYYQGVQILRQLVV